MFDGMICNQVVHHLSTGEEAEPFSRLRTLMVEAYRVLRSGGILVFNTSSHRQLRDGYWWADLIPAAVHKIARRFPTLEGMCSMLAEVGFCCGEPIMLVDEVLQGKSYWDPHGPFDK